MTETLKRTRYGAVNYGSQKEVCKKASKAGRRFEKKKTEEQQLKFLRVRRLRQVLQIREMYYEGRGRLAKYRYSLDLVVRLWESQGWSEKEVLDVIFYRTHKALFPRES